jgi:hypothetical protein
MRLTIFRNVFNRRNQPINIYAGPDERLYNSEDESESDQNSPVPTREPTTRRTRFRAVVHRSRPYLLIDQIQENANNANDMSFMDRFTFETQYPPPVRTQCDVTLCSHIETLKLMFDCMPVTRHTHLSQLKQLQHLTHQFETQMSTRTTLLPCLAKPSMRRTYLTSSNNLTT